MLVAHRGVERWDESGREAGSQPRPQSRAHTCGSPVRLWFCRFSSDAVGLDVESWGSNAFGLDVESWVGCGVLGRVGWVWSPWGNTHV